MSPPAIHPTPDSDRQAAARTPPDTTQRPFEDELTSHTPNIEYATKPLSRPRGAATAGHHKHKSKSDYFETVFS
jgi:hypothetical protein